MNPRGHVAEQAVTVWRDSLGLPERYEPPAGELERRIADAFARALRVDRVGREDCFFDLGGDSLAAVQVALVLSDSAGQEVPVSLLAQASSPAQLARALAQRHGPGGLEPGAASRPPIFAVHGQQGYMLPHKEFMAGLHPGQALRMFELPGLRDGAKRLKRVPEIAAAYCAELQAEYPSGPIRLCGFCMGSLIAIEMTMQLAAMGRPVAQLVLVEPNASRALIELHEKKLWDDARALAELGSETMRARMEAIQRAQLLALREQGRDSFLKRYPGQAFSTDARAKLLAAFYTYRPGRLEMPVDVIVSLDRKWSMESPCTWDHSIPNRRVHLAGETHREIMASSRKGTAVLIQSLFG